MVLFIGPDSVFSAGEGVSSVDAWYSTTIDIEEVLSNTRQGNFLLFVADVVKSFDTVDPDILDCALGRLGLPAYGCEGAAISVSSLSAFRAAVARAVWSSKTLHDQYSGIVELVGWPLGI